MSGIRVFRDRATIVKTIEKFQANTKTFWGACVDSGLPSFSVGSVKKGYEEAKKRGVQIFYITEVTKDNLLYCKEIMQFAELRHMEGVRGNFAISDSEYVAGVMRGGTLTILVWSDVKELVLQQRQVFDTLWNLSVPARKRVK